MVHKKKKKKRTLFHKVYIPETTQDMIAYLFKEVDEKTGIFKITGVFWDYLSVFSLASFIVTGIIYYILRKVKE